MVNRHLINFISIGIFNFRLMRSSSQLGGPKPIFGGKGIGMKSVDPNTQKKNVCTSNYQGRSDTLPNPS